MSGWLRYFTLRAQVSTGLSAQIAIWLLKPVLTCALSVK